MTTDINAALSDKLVKLAIDAGVVIMDVYNAASGIDTDTKKDDSPVTVADQKAEDLILAGLKEAAPEIPVLAEESVAAGKIPELGEQFFLVDPLDGTKEFIKKGTDFTVNIALIVSGRPVMGVVYAPALEKSYVGIVGQGAWTETAEGVNPISAKLHSEGEVWKVVGSRSHQSPEIKNLLELLGGESELVAMGSSLKLCLVAEGEAHLYPRLGPTSEWDTGAAHAVALAAGANVTVLDGANPLNPDAEALTYNQKESVLNPYFLVSA